MNCIMPWVEQRCLLCSAMGLDYAQVGVLLGLPHVIGVAIDWVLMLLGDTRLRKTLVVAGGLAVAASVLLIGGGASFAMILGATLYPFGFGLSF